MKLALRFGIVFLAAALTGALALPRAFAEDPDQPAPAPAAEKQEKKPDAPKAKVSPDAQKVIDQVDAAYGKLKSLELAGTFSGDIQAAGQQRKESKKFTATFAAPNKFRHALEDDILV